VLPAEVLQLLLDVDGAASKARPRDDEIAGRDPENQRTVLERQVRSQEVDDAGMKFEPLVRKNLVF
jgi:hypothetical protein